MRQPDTKADEHPSVGELVSRASEQLSTLVRQELQLARTELAEKGKQAGRGGGLLGAAGAVAYVAFMVLAAAAVAALALELPVWASALIVSGVLFLTAGALAAAGRKRLGRAAPPVPEQALDSVRADVAEIKERAAR
ncbi:phage holin family protein [Streptomyces sp. TRM66268-LWL]|uniref:Phage holin family protein n=1 Tax=Streptomyces polyasparticus TaxID=2767826 RepID=A0ABR7SBD8_9ACTN|nr:phage holin family protein [Streptomyces polyasparticus]MBC9711927.1 phage holin family protein [Streptomyces polyasparticus]